MAKKKIEHARTGAFDRGATPYFHGRTAILKDFESILSNVRASRKGTIHLIIGDPGAGKSALLDQCKKRAKLRGWKVVQITPATLWDPRKMMNALGYKNIPIPNTIALSVPDVLKLEASSSKPRKRFIPKILSKRKRRPLLLLMDEAQKLSSASEYTVEQREDVKELLDVIHNAHLRKPVVLLAAGLRTTLAALQVLDISRFGEKNIVRLGRLSENPERAVIRDWIMVEAAVKEYPAEWIDAIVKETLGWPRHVHSYARTASDYLIENGGMMTPEGLKEVMEEGRKGRIQYYTQRVEQMDGDDVLCLAEAINGVRAGAPFTKKMIISEFKKDHGADKAEGIFSKFIEKGVIVKDEQAYSIPIPSMHDWMKSELKRHKERLRLAKEDATENLKTQNKS